MYFMIHILCMLCRRLSHQNENISIKYMSLVLAYSKVKYYFFFINILYTRLCFFIVTHTCHLGFQ
jgi:hypothetical protein